MTSFLQPSKEPWLTIEREAVKRIALASGVYSKSKLDLDIAVQCHFAVSDVRYVTLAMTHRNGPYKFNLTYAVIYDTALVPDIDAWWVSFRRDPWKGYTGHKWKLDGYKVDDAIADSMMNIQQGADSYEEMVALLRRLRGRSYDA